MDQQKQQAAIDAIIQHPRLACSISSIQNEPGRPSRLEVNGSLLTSADLRELADLLDDLTRVKQL